MANTTTAICALEDDLVHVISRMTEERTRHMPMVEKEVIRGIISIGDVVRYRLQELETESHHLRAYIAGADVNATPGTMYA